VGFAEFWLLLSHVSVVAVHKLCSYLFLPNGKNTFGWMEVLNQILKVMRTANAEIDFLKFDEYNTLIGSLGENVFFQSFIEILVVNRFYFEHLELADAINEISHVLMLCDPLKLSSKQYLNNFAHFLLVSIPTLNFIVTVDTISHMPVD
jgi:hypothetical protein